MFPACTSAAPHEDTGEQELSLRLGTAHFLPKGSSGWNTGMGHKRGQTSQAICQKHRALPSTGSELNVVHSRHRKAKAAKPGEEGKNKKHVPGSYSCWQLQYHFRILVNTKQGKFFFWRCRAKQIEISRRSICCQEEGDSSKCSKHFPCPPALAMQEVRRSKPWRAGQAAPSARHRVLPWSAFQAASAGKFTGCFRLSLKCFLLYLRQQTLWPMLENANK